MIFVMKDIYRRESKLSFRNHLLFEMISFCRQYSLFVVDQYSIHNEDERISIHFRIVEFHLDDHDSHIDVYSIIPVPIRSMKLIQCLLILRTSILVFVIVRSFELNEVYHGQVFV